MINHLSFLKWSLFSWILILCCILLSLLVVDGGRRESDRVSHPFPWRKQGQPSHFRFTSVSGAQVSLFRPLSSPVLSPGESPLIPINRSQTCSLEREWLFQELGVWDPPWSSNPRISKRPLKLTTTPSSPQLQIQRDQNYNPYSFLDNDDLKDNATQGSEDDNYPHHFGDDEENNMSKLESTLSRVKLLPDQRHVSVFLHKGVVKRFLFINDNFGNPLSITITPCTSILHWVVQHWPVLESNSSISNLFLEAPLHLKTFRTQRPTTFSLTFASRGVYSIDIRPISYDSYAHIYATSSVSGPTQLFPSNSGPSKSSSFVQHIFTHVELELVQKPRQNKVKVNQESGQGQEFDPLNTLLHSNSSPKPRIWAQRLSGQRLHVRWDVSPLNPHLMEYCLVVNSRRDYSSLCSATGDKWGVLPPDLMHVSYYGGGLRGPEHSQSPLSTPEGHRHRHGHGVSSLQEAQSALVIGCTNKRTNYILNNLEEGLLYYFNVFVRDTSSNVSLPYVATTLKYYTPKTPPNTLKDNKPTQFPLFTLDGSVATPLNVSTIKFNLNKPCSQFTLYVMPCGGGALTFTLLHGNRTLYNSDPTQTLDIVQIALPQKGKYFVKIYPELGSGPDNWAKLVEIFVAKKNRRLPLPRMPSNTILTEDIERRSCDGVTIQWFPSPDPRDNEYCIFLKETPNRGSTSSFIFKKPNQCDVDRSLRTDPYVSHSLCVQKTGASETLLLSQRIVGLHPNKTYVVQLILRRHNGKSLSYDLTVVKTLGMCSES